MAPRPIVGMPGGATNAPNDGMRPSRKLVAVPPSGRSMANGGGGIPPAGPTGSPGGRSGAGFVHNTYFLTTPQKTILRGPCRSVPKPVWFATHRRSTKALWRLCQFYLDGRLRHLPPLLWHAMRP